MPQKTFIRVHTQIQLESYQNMELTNESSQSISYLFSIVAIKYLLVTQWGVKTIKEANYSTNKKLVKEYVCYRVYGILKQLKQYLNQRFQRDRTMQLFWDKGTEIPSLSRDKGTTGQAQNLATGWDGSGQPVKIRDGMGRDNHYCMV